MKILVTGGLGLIGSEVAERAAAQGHEVWACDDRRAAVTDCLDGVALYGCAIEELPPVIGFDVIVHCAAPVGPLGIIGKDVLADMISSTDAAIDLARRADAALVALSSSEVYGTTSPQGCLVVPDEWSYRTEYGVGKIVTEQMARRHHAATGLPTAIVRPWNVTGSRQAGSKGFVFPRMAAQAAAGEAITVYRPGGQRRAFMDVRDFATLLLERIDDLGGDGWDATPMDAASPQNAVSMIDLAMMFGPGLEVIDPVAEHGPDFREAAAGTKLPPPEVAMRGWTSLEAMVERAKHALTDEPLAAA